MTWVFGSAMFLGSAILVGDVQVTLGDGRTVDCLQKVYALDQNVLGGFAGDVYAGFARLDAQHQSGSAVMVAGASPNEKALYGSRARLARFTYPHFNADEIATNEWAAIGSGSDVEAYREELQTAMGEEARNLLVMESNNPGGFANTLTITIIMNVFDMPSVSGIAKHFHIGTVFADRCWIRKSDRELFAEGPPQQIRMPPVATSWSELLAVLQQQLGTAVTAVRA